ncbi:5-formyltetrahydrofolate cyclo-ligase [Volucribacter psittacicida]|uniref:5-formyltetrahydrofolate cyclo-ligase n=1 Tax=Volucribacter psittacicida TaxID=203482 RepID=A0A4R1FTQ1_9PAST|nr:5-formyltetrahydrofolate cyclo-ligase [Volucribacter psittacicida]TCJ98656.1 5-formyltetrahydrofolate cyclo-ligase [Volucribacter psittacicida]
MQTRQQIRNQIKKTREKLTALQQAQAEKNITQQALQFITQQQAHHIALYLSHKGEISTALLIQTLWQQQKKVYLPVLHPFCPGHLLFQQYLPNTPMNRNKFGIPEPQLDCSTLIPFQQLDLIFTPLVAFDSQGNRLGMGGGFYDRTLANWQQKKVLPIGLAHACQQVSHIPMQDWDIPLYKILVA